MNEYEKRARDLFLAGYNCAQSVFAAFADKMGMSEKDALKISSGFGGGLGRMREVCGSVSAMAMVLGNLYGYTDSSADDEKKALYELIQNCGARFKDEYKTLVCRELLSLGKNDMPSPTPTVRSAEFYKQRPCLGFVVASAGILSDVINEKEAAI